MNPNVYIDVEADLQKMMYQVRGANPESVAERGVTSRLFRVGDRVNVSGFLAVDRTWERTGPPIRVGIAILVLPNGNEVFLDRSLLP